jgi:hypothetical protein
MPEDDEGTGVVSVFAREGIDPSEYVVPITDGDLAVSQAAVRR